MAKTINTNQGRGVVAINGTRGAITMDSQNRVRNSDFARGLDSWSVNNGTQICEVVQRTDKAWLHIKGSGAYGAGAAVHGVIQPLTVRVAGGQAVTVSFRAAGAAENQVCVALLRLGNADDGMIGASFDAFVLGTDEQTYTMTKVMPPETVTLRLGIYTNSDVSSYRPPVANTTNEYYITDIKLELGNVATGWTRAPEDLVTTVNGASGAVEIGGANILRSKDPATFGGPTITTERNVSVPEWGASDAVRMHGKGGTNRIIIFYVATGMRAIVGANTLCDSVYIRNDGPREIAICPNTVDQFTTDNTPIMPGESKRASIAYTTDGVRDIHIKVITKDVGDDFDFTIWRPKIEVGSVMTDWCPAWDDIFSRLAALEAKVGITAADPPMIEGPEIMDGTADHAGG